MVNSARDWTRIHYNASRPQNNKILRGIRNQFSARDIFSEVYVQLARSEIFARNPKYVTRNSKD